MNKEVLFAQTLEQVRKTAKEQAGVEAITGLYEENPAVDMFKKDVYILRVAKSAAGIRKAVPLMAGFARKLLTGEPIDYANMVISLRQRLY